MKLIEMSAHLGLVYIRKLNQQSLNFQNDLIDLLAITLFCSSCNKTVFLKAISLTHNIAFNKKSQVIIDNVWNFFQRYWPFFLDKRQEGFVIKEMEAKILLSMFLIKDDLNFLKMSISFYKKADSMLIPSFPYTLAYRNYHFYKGRAFFESYKNFAITSDIIEAVESLKKAYLSGGKNSPEICCLYAEILTQLSDYLGEIQPLNLAIICASNAVFLTSKVKSYSLNEHKIFWIIYILALKKKFDLTHTFKDFNKLLKALDQAKQKIINTDYFSIIFGEVAIFYGSAFSNAYWLELGISKLTFLSNSSKNLSLFVRGISNLGVLIEKVSLVREGYLKVISSLKYASNDVSLLNALGENAYCLGVYFEEKKFFIQAANYFEVALKISFKNRLLQFNLAKTYFEQGRLFKDLQAFSLSESLFFELSLSYPNSILYLYYLSKIFFHKSNNTKDEQKSLNYLRISLEKINQILDIEENYGYFFLKSQILFSLEIKLKNTSYVKQSLSILEKLFEKNNKDIFLLKFFIEILFYLYNLDKNRNYLNRIIQLSECILLINLEDDQAYLFQGKALLFLFDCDAERIFFSLWKDLAKTNLSKAIVLGNKEAHYWLACLYALESSVDRVVFYLKQSLRKGFSLSKEKIKNSIYFNKIRDDKEFSDFLFNLIEERF